MRKIIASLDVGTNSIKIVVGEIYKKKLNVLASTSVVSRGVKSGYIVNFESASEAIKEAFSKINDTLGYLVKDVVLCIPSYEISSFASSASIEIKDSIVKKDDKLEVLNLSMKDKITSQYKLVCYSPVYYVLNDNEKIANPVGANAFKLSVKSIGNVVSNKNINNLKRCLNNIGINVVDVLPGAICDYNQYADVNKRNSNGAIVNIGASKTEVSIFNKGILTNCEVLNVGGLTIDLALAKYYKLTKNDAIYVKEKLITLDKNKVKASEALTLENKNGDIIKINQYDSSEIAIENMIEILNMVKKQINLLTKKEISYIIVTGGITHISNFEFLLEEIFNRNAKVAKVLEIGIRDNKYSSCAGLIKYYYKNLKLNNKDFSILNKDQTEEFSGLHKKINITGSSPLGKLFGYFFDS